MDFLYKMLKNSIERWWNYTKSCRYVVDFFFECHTVTCDITGDCDIVTVPSWPSSVGPIFMTTFFLLLFIQYCRLHKVELDLLQEFPCPSLVQVERIQFEPRPTRVHSGKIQTISFNWQLAHILDTNAHVFVLFYVPSKNSQRIFNSTNLFN